MSGSATGILFATICNTVGEASGYALWFTDGSRQFVVDLSDHLGESSGLTGIAYHDGRIYLAVQSPASRILVLDTALNVIDTITHEGFNDLHSLHVAGDMLFAVSARGGCLLRRDLRTGDIVTQVRFDPRAWVCDLHCTRDDIWLCCHHLSFLDPAAQGGGVFSVRDRKAIVEGLARPHSLIPCRDGFVVLDSANAQVVFFNCAGARTVQRLEGFLRGAVVTGPNSLLVASGPDRTMSRKNPVGDGARGLRDVLDERLKIFELTDGKLARTLLPELPGFEIYDFLALPPGVALHPTSDRIVQVEQGVFARFYYAALVTAHARAHQPPAS
jgi:hypothetical protein